MTKKEAIQIFMESYGDNIKELRETRDFIAIRCAWNDFTDMLYKDGQITSYQYNNWLNPFAK
jgi:hypothetical protein